MNGSPGRVAPADTLTRALQRITALFALLACTGLVCAQSTPLNDTGQITCYNYTSTGTVAPATPDPETAGFNAQDCTRGAAAADAMGKMVKIGASTTPGRDYTKIANDGSELPASAMLGSGPTDWACTRDNLTGLIWEVKVNNPAHLRHYEHRYAWYDTNTAINGGNAGSTGGTGCNAPLPGNFCNTSAFRAAVNALAGANRLCGATGWRMPTWLELQSLVDYGAGAAPYIDATYFPNTNFSNAYWTGDNYAPNASRAWVVYFNSGHIIGSNKGLSHAVRLVRGGQ
ncbi:DUF1566 domain-containing protein [Xanthomonadaceae bacterium JHOS43]|nr:DUF1566 domain-containing protein [Xanthomonadaceae bacterium JHOS43]